jgi:hypothetical protein
MRRRFPLWFAESRRELNKGEMMKFKRVLASLNGLSIGQALRIITELPKEKRC